MGCASSTASPKRETVSGFRQCLVILRHSERRDQTDPAFMETDEHKAWPFDTPLTQSGIQLAHDVGVELQSVHKSAQFSLVVTSPYRRCMQTAAEVAKVLNLDLLIDQEVGEVRDKTMPSDGPAHRSTAELKDMAKELGVKLRNPDLPEGGFKIFGKVPPHGEVTKDGHIRCQVRVEHYITDSEKTEQNFIVVSHAPAVAAMMDIFQHGMCDIEKLDYCARVIATRKVGSTDRSQELTHDKSVFASQWDVDSKGIKHGLNFDATEDDHERACGENLKAVEQRRLRNTQSDAMLDDVMKQSSSSKGNS